jgi:hypothetical protein
MLPSTRIRAKLEKGFTNVLALLEATAGVDVPIDPNSSEA